MAPCSKHPKRKKGKCSSCGVHKCCPALSTCTTVDDHWNNTKIVDNLSDSFTDNVFDNLGDNLTTKLAESLPPNSDDNFFENVDSTTGKKRKSLDIVMNATNNKHCKIATQLNFGEENNSVDSLAASTSFDQYITPQKNRWSKPHEINIPPSGFKPSTIFKQAGRTYRRARLTFLRNLNILSQRICPSNPALCQTFMKDTVAEKEHEELLELKKNVTQLYLTGDNTVSTVCASILGKTLGHTNVQSSVTTCFKDHEDSEIPVKASRIRFGKKRF